MIEQPVPFKQESLKLFFSSKRFLLEAIVGEQLIDADFHQLLQQIRGRDLTNRQRKLTTILKTHHPALMIKFMGLRMFSTTEWWVALIQMNPNVPDPGRVHITPTLLLRGWNNIHGVEAECIGVGGPEALLIEMEEKVEQKKNKGYKEDCVLENFQLAPGVSVMPLIPGLPPPEPSPVFSSHEELREFTEEEEPHMAIPSTSSKKTSSPTSEEEEEEILEELPPSSSPFDSSTEEEMVTPATLESSKKEKEKEAKAAFRAKMKERRKRSEW